MNTSHTGSSYQRAIDTDKALDAEVRLNRTAPMPELPRLRMNLATINDRLSTLKAEAEALLLQRAPIERRIAELEDALTDEQESTGKQA